MLCALVAVQYNLLIDTLIRPYTVLDLVCSNKQTAYNVNTFTQAINLDIFDLHILM